MEVSRDTTSAHPEDGDLLRIAAQIPDVVLDPAEGQSLVLEAQVTWQNTVVGRYKTCNERDFAARW